MNSHQAVLAAPFPYIDFIKWCVGSTFCNFNSVYMLHHALLFQINQGQYGYACRYQHLRVTQHTNMHIHIHEYTGIHKRAHFHTGAHIQRLYNENNSAETFRQYVPLMHIYNCA